MMSMEKDWSLMRQVMAKDTTMRQKGFVVAEENRFYYRTLSRFKTLYVESKGIKTIGTFEKRQVHVYDVYTIATTRLGSQSKVLRKQITFDVMLAYIDSYLAFLERNRYG